MIINIAIGCESLYENLYMIIVSYHLDMTNSNLTFAPIKLCVQHHLVHPRQQHYTDKENFMVENLSRC